MARGLLHNRGMRPRTLALATLLFLASAAANATVLRAIAFEEKVDRADAILLGRCIAQTSHFDATRDWILTRSTFRVEKTMKGLPAQEITIVTPGGTAGNVAQEVIGIPKFRKGDENLLFVRHSSAGPTVLYFEQGAYRVQEDGRGERVVRPMLSTPIVAGNGRGTTIVPEPPRNLRDFERDVVETVRRREAQRMQMIEQRRREESSLRFRLRRNAPLVALAVVGALLASWQLYRRW